MGGVQPKLIGRFKRLNTFIPDDYDTLEGLLKHFDRILTTPNILTEVSNLTAQLTGKARIDCFDAFGIRLEVVVEEYIESRKVTSEPMFNEFGMTDTVITILARDRRLILTNDFRLSQSLLRTGMDAINFNHLRPSNW